MTPEMLASRLAALRGYPFTKMSGSGNDFVVLDGRQVPRPLVEAPEVIRAICSRHNGIGADGVVILEPEPDADLGHAAVRLSYFNSDGSPADLCGNATLCSTALAARIGLAPGSAMQLRTGAGVISSRMAPHDGGRPEITLQPVADLRPEVPLNLGPGELRIGYAMAGVPHLVIQCADAESVDLPARGPGLRWHQALGAAGANVNWVSRRPDGDWRYRTFERGVEGETLACGTGAVATAALLAQWGESVGDGISLRTTSGRDLAIRFHPNAADPMRPIPVLVGEGRVVFTGLFADLA